MQHMKFSLDSLIRKPIRFLGSPIDVSKHKLEVIELSEGHRSEVIPSIYLPGHFDRIQSTSTSTDLTIPHLHAHQTVVTHEPTLLFNIGEARLWNGLIHKNIRNYILRKVCAEDIFSDVDLDCAYIADTDNGHQYFGHWLRDDVTATLINAKQIHPIFLQKPKHFQVTEYESLINPNYILAKKGRVKNLHILSDFSQNSHKVARYMEIRRRIKESLKPISTKFNGVYIVRGNLGIKRILTNENEVIEHLSKRGFDIVYPEKMSVGETQKRLWDASLVINVEGSAHVHALHSMSLKGALLHLQPPFRFVDIAKGVFNSTGRVYGFYVCKPTHNNDNFYLDNFSDLDKLIDLIRNACEK